MENTFYVCGKHILHNLLIENIEHTFYAFYSIENIFYLIENTFY